ncbi:hypothetical protein TIFTF001_024299 [Ficus carica]|uniref:Uncharacterized protein n=1 Tax=Ficus carica TaxID=3494 RepID=A0AA88AMA9_FICCA|nr:hypothetical protein TIFTF001_024299 [Ficus carica]
MVRSFGWLKKRDKERVGQASIERLGDLNVAQVIAGFRPTDRAKGGLRLFSQPPDHPAPQQPKRSGKRNLANMILSRLIPKSKYKKRNTTNTDPLPPPGVPATFKPNWRLNPDTGYYECVDEEFDDSDESEGDYIPELDGERVDHEAVDVANAKGNAETGV